VAAVCLCVAPIPKQKLKGLSAAMARAVQICRKEGLLHAVSQRALPPPAEAGQSIGTGSVLHGGYTYIEPAAPADLNVQLENMAIKPMFSIVVPAYNTPPALLTAAIESVKKQWYPYWELILVNDASPARETRAALERVDDKRIKILHLGKKRWNFWRY